MTKVQEIKLKGEWRFTPEGQETTKIQVPGGGWLKQGFRCEAGIKWQGRKLRLSGRSEKAV